MPERGVTATPARGASELVDEEVGLADHGHARARGKLSQSQSVLLHEVEQALRRREFGVLVDRVLVVGEYGAQLAAPNSVSAVKKPAFFSNARSIRCCEARTADL
jgi:hypothetical protein